MFLSLPASKMISFFNKMSFSVEILLHYSSGLLQGMNYIWACYFLVSVLKQNEGKCFFLCFSREFLFFLGPKYIFIILCVCVFKILEYDIPHKMLMTKGHMLDGNS